MSDAIRPRGGFPALPGKTEVAVLRLLLEPWRFVTAPVIYGLDRVPRDRPFLLVGNHTLMGVLDVPFLLLAIYDHCGIFVRPVGDHLHFEVPLWRDLIERFGTVDGTREKCRALMRAGEPLLVFPGGGREVFKRKGEQYRLIWKHRLGFVRLAVEFGYPIVPFAAVGAEECYDIVLDGPELLESALGGVLERFAPRLDEIPPLVRGVGPFPRPQRFYFGIGTPIETQHVRGRHEDDAACTRVRDGVARAIEQGLTFLEAERAHDPQRHLVPRLLAQTEGWLRVLASNGGRPGTPRRRSQARPGRRRRNRPR